METSKNHANDKNSKVSQKWRILELCWIALSFSWYCASIKIDSFDDFPHPHFLMFLVLQCKIYFISWRHMGISPRIYRLWSLGLIHHQHLLGLLNSYNSRFWRYSSRNTSRILHLSHMDGCWNSCLHIHSRKYVHYNHWWWWKADRVK